MLFDIFLYIYINDVLQIIIPITNIKLTSLLALYFKFKNKKHVTLKYQGKVHSTVIQWLFCSQ